MNESQQGRYEPVDASPVKSFFVSMLTRDIQLEDAILDLLDNCVDGILRSNGGSRSRPYEGFKADIKFDAKSFSIHDNCGGIPLNLRNYAFRMGRVLDSPQGASGSVGVYGIGMKRAIFKIGRNCRISTRSEGSQYEVEITPDWIEDESEWELPVREAGNPEDYDGTNIDVDNLNPGISKTFGEGAKSFSSDLRQTIATHYAYIIEKGFEVTINGARVKPRTTKLVHDNRENAPANAIRPFVFRTTTEDGVQVYLAVGFTRPIPSEDEVREEQEAARYSSVDAGWTILCNDRVVLYCNRDELTGWGDAGVPRYHPQFIAISGIVDFRSEDPSKLPTTTTKRGIDASSTLFLQVKSKMREGMRVFTNYTNKWKGLEQESRFYIEQGTPLSLEELKLTAEMLKFNKTQKPPSGEQSKPDLPLPPGRERTTRRISFEREISKIRTVANYLGDPDMQPPKVGENCFEIIHAEAKE